MVQMSLKFWITDAHIVWVENVACETMDFIITALQLKESHLPLNGNSRSLSIAINKFEVKHQILNPYIC